MNTSFALLLLSLDAAASVAAPTSTEAATPAAAIDRVALEVDHEPLLQQQKATAAEKSGFFVRDDATRALRERHRVEVVGDAKAPAILVTLSWKDYENSVYRIEVSTRQPGEAPKLVEAFEATCINNSALVEVVLAKLPAALEQLVQPAAQDPGPSVAEPDPTPDSSEPTQPPIKDTTTQDAAIMGPVGIVGVVASVGGLGMVGFGISRLIKGESRERDAERDQFGVIRDFRPQGRAFLGAGMGVAAVGVTMLVVDLTVLHKRRAGAMAIVPSFGGDVVGLEVRGRF